MGKTKATRVKKINIDNEVKIARDRYNILQGKFNSPCYKYNFNKKYIKKNERKYILSSWANTCKKINIDKYVKQRENQDKYKEIIEKMRGGGKQNYDKLTAKEKKKYRWYIKKNSLIEIEAREKWIKIKCREKQMINSVGMGGKR